MPTCRNPEATDSKRIPIITQMQRGDSGTANGSQANNVYSVRAPLEMIKPVLLTRIE
jgi:hypothetical protein